MDYEKIQLKFGVIDIAFGIPNNKQIEKYNTGIINIGKHELSKRGINTLSYNIHVEYLTERNGKIPYIVWALKT